ncbi:type IV toxin-antitoxin system AbiEi family antitoxin domain-containing protein [Phytohabitans suffuscus]
MATGWQQTVMGSWPLINHSTTQMRHNQARVVPPDQRLGVSEDQWGLFTKRQAEDVGMAWTTIARLARDAGAERVAPGVYRLRGAPADEHLALRAAWLQLAPDVRAWERTPAQGVVSHRSAAALFGLGELPADVHQFTLPARRQTRRPDVRLHRATLRDDEWTRRQGQPVTRPSRTAADLLGDREDPGAVARVIADALRTAVDNVAAVVKAITPYTARFGLRPGDGAGLLDLLLESAGIAKREEWLVSPAGSSDR